jgi:hypothetical protein
MTMMVIIINKVSNYREKEDIVHVVSVSSCPVVESVSV